MSLKEMFDAALLAEGLWQALMPDIPAPDRSQFLKWLGAHGDSALSYALARTSRKASKAVMSTNDAARYCSAVLRDERAKQTSYSIGVPKHANL